MTTFELPPEPPIGSRVRDASGREWVSDATVGWKSGDESGQMVVGWALLMGYHGPLTLIEPDPWPTHELIVADRGGRVNRRGLFARWQTDEDYVDIAGVTSDDVYDLATRTLDSLTNVVPVRVVPVAEYEALAEQVRAHFHSESAHCYSCALLRATDALGVDL